MSIAVLQYVKNTQGVFEFDDLNTKLFKFTEDAVAAILQIAKDEYPDADPEVFENIDNLDDYLIRLENDDYPVLMYRITEIKLDT